MEEGTRNWLDKIENKLDGVRLDFAQGFAELKAKLDFASNTQVKHEERIGVVEEYIHAQKALNEQNEKDRKYKWAKITGVVLLIEAVMILGGLLLQRFWG